MNKVGRKSGGNRWVGVDPCDRLMEKCESGPMYTDGTRCLVWKDRALNNSGYATFWLNGRHMPAHRAAWILHNGQEIPEGLEIDHLCRVRHCVNPLHLEAVTRRTNVVRGMGIPGQRARQTHCKRGHEFTPENTYVSKRGHRTCRRCHADDELTRKANLRRSIEMLEL